MKILLALDGSATTRRMLSFELIVMGTHGHPALGSVVHGSVTTGVLARTRLPVLLIH